MKSNPLSQKRCWAVLSGVLAIPLLCLGCAQAAPPGLKLANDKLCVRVEALEENLFRFEYCPAGEKPAERTIASSPMIARRNFTGPRAHEKMSANDISTGEARVQVATSSLDAAFSRAACGDDLSWEGLFDLKAVEVSEGRCVFVIDAPSMTHAYGLGEQFDRAADANGDWIGRVRIPGCEFGNRMVPFKGGAVGNAMFPVLYMLGKDGRACALFLDDLSALKWDFSRRPWRVETTGSKLRGYVLTEEGIDELRRKYMELVGRPPVPPRAAFGLWISEYGYDDWNELEDKLASLRKAEFPVDGFILDLQWFGGVKPGGEKSRMGYLAWDTAKFPDARARISKLRQREGIGIIPIEESYITRGLAEHKRLSDQGYLAKSSDGQPLFLKSWWGHGGMLDWTNPAAGDLWHDWKRQPLIQDGIVGHWTDLGEPEDYDANASYYGVPGGGTRHRDVHNYYNFAWAEGIHRGYQRNRAETRPFIMSRSGVSGIQRFGAAMWSGDLGSNMPSLNMHFNTQLHMAMAGVDYYGSDIGGFHRTALDGDMRELYTQWFAAGAALDVPVRPHTSNTDNRFETAPDRIGDLMSNLANIRRRYELIPYIYSLAHRAYGSGEPVFPPPFYHYPADGRLRRIGDQKMIGPHLMVGLAAEYGRRARDVYLPEGTWFDWHTDDRIQSAGQLVSDVPLYRDALFTLPLYAASGAIVPLAHVDGQTMNSHGMRRDGTRRDELIVRVFEGDRRSEFTLFDDDGWSTAYQRGEVQRTLLEHKSDHDGVDFLIGGSRGDYAGAPSMRGGVVRLTTRGRPQCAGVTLNGRSLTRFATQEELDAAPSGWHQPSRSVIVAKGEPMKVSGDKLFRFRLTAD